MPVVITDQARARRAREVLNALAVVRMDGLEPSDEAKSVFECYVDGELTPDELNRAFDMYFRRGSGPARLGQNKIRLVSRLAECPVPDQSRL